MDLITKYNNYQLALRERKETETIEKIFPLHFDHFYTIEIDDERFEKPITVGVLATSDIEGAVYIEWIEISIAFRSNGFFYQVMHLLRNSFPTKNIALESSNENLLMYVKLGFSNDHIDNCTGLHYLIWK